MDLTKLPPAPVVSWCVQQNISEGGKAYGGIVAPFSNWSPLVQLDHAVALDADFAAFAALARNAFDVMMRRGWWVTPWFGNWRVWGEHQQRQGEDSADPFTALVEADRWYKENVENKHDS